MWSKVPFPLQISRLVLALSLRSSHTLWRQTSLPLTLRSIPGLYQPPAVPFNFPCNDHPPVHITEAAVPSYSLAEPLLDEPPQFKTLFCLL